MRGGAFVLGYGYAVQVAAAMMSLAFSPYILRTIGPEAYGLVGVFLIIQAWFQLLDAGLTPALTRETARFRGGAVDARTLKDTVKGLESVVLLAALPVLVIALAVAEPVAAHWVQRESLSLPEVVVALDLMALILLLRWYSGIRRGIVVGYERHGSIYTLTLIVALLRYPCIVLYFQWVEASVAAYFVWQVGVSVVEVVVLWWLAGRLVPAGAVSPVLACIGALRGIAAFALSHVFLALLWILITQTDKLLLSRLLTLSQFGYLSLAVSAAAGVNLIAAPLGQMLMPRLSRLKAAGDEPGVVHAYRRGTRAMAVFVASVAALMAAFGTSLVWVWTGDQGIAALVGEVLGWYAVGNAAMAFSAFAYYLQYASGRLRMHTWGTIGFLAVIVPLLVVATTRDGMRGASICWAAAWIVYLLVWVTITHRAYLQRLHWRWLMGDVLRIVVPVALTAWLLQAAAPLPAARLLQGFALLGFGVVLFSVALLASGLVPWRRLILRLAKREPGPAADSGPHRGAR